MKQPKYSYIRALSIAIVASSISTSAHAVKLGVNFGSTFGEAAFDSNSPDVDLEIQEFGFTLDTRRQGKVFAYRLNANIAAGDINPDIDISGVNVTNTFAFQVNGASNNAMAFWIGPSISLGLFEGSSDSFTEDAVFVAIGPTFGLDIPGESGDPGFSIELGYRIGGIVFENDIQNGDPDLSSTEVLLRGAILFGR